MLAMLRLAAAPVDSAEVRLIAEHYFKYLNPGKSKPKIIQLKPSEYKGLVTRYTCVFENNDFMIVSADDATVPIFAYSRNQSFYVEMPPDYLWWIENEYDLMVYNSHKQSIKNTLTRPLWDAIIEDRLIDTKSTQSVVPLIASRWGQTRSNDQKCPGFNAQVPQSNPACGCGQCTAGCVAVAMAQIIHYWQFPETGARGPFDWCNMPDYLIKNNGSQLRPEYEAEYLAVSGLLADCGITADLQYCSSNCATSSTLEKAKAALEQAYGYSHNIYHRYRWLSSNWKDRLRGNLELGMPVLYGGQSEYAGHAFICDGYENTDYFHFNWGWNGAYDGYFYISGSDGAPEIDFDALQSAIFNIYPENPVFPECFTCSDEIHLSNTMQEENPYNQPFPMILWNGISASYNYGSLPYPALPPKAHLVILNGDIYIDYDDMIAGAIYANEMQLPDRTRVRLRAFQMIELSNVETIPGAEFLAELVDCPYNGKIRLIAPLDSSFKLPDFQANNVDQDLLFRLWPNPVNTFVNISFEIDRLANISIALRDLYGRLLQNINYNPTSTGIQALQLDISSYPSGTYSCEFRSAQGTRIQKLVIARNP